MGNRPHVVDNPRFHVPEGIWERVGRFQADRLEEIGREMAATGSPVNKIIGRNTRNGELVEWVPDKGWIDAPSAVRDGRPRQLLRVRDREGTYGFGFVEARSERGVYASFPKGADLVTVRLPEESLSILPSRIQARIYSIFRDGEGFWRDEEVMTVDVTDTVLSLSAEEVAAMKDNDPSSDEIASIAGFDQPCRVEVVSAIASYFDVAPELLGRGVVPPNISEFSIEQNRSIMARARPTFHLAPDADPGRGLHL